MTEGSAMTTAPAADDIAIRLDELQKTYFLSGGMEVPVLKGISLEVPKGEFLGIMGSSGSGKSTMLNILGL